MMRFSSSNNTDRKKRELGASLVEYALLVVLIALVAIPAVDMAGGSAEGQFCNVYKALGGKAQSGVCEKVIPPAK